MEIEEEDPRLKSWEEVAIDLKEFVKSKYREYQSKQRSLQNTRALPSKKEALFFGEVHQEQNVFLGKLHSQEPIRESEDDVEEQLSFNLEE